MNWYLLTFRSVTLAQRGERMLQRGGVNAAMSRAPKWMEERGCGYCLRLRGRDLSRAKELLSEGGLPYRRLYAQRPDGTWEERV